MAVAAFKDLCLDAVDQSAVAGFWAAVLGAPLEVLAVRKLGAPHNPEYGIGAIAEGGTRVFDTEALAVLGINGGVLDSIVAREAEELRRRMTAYRGERPLAELEGRTAIVVDDGVATGVTDTAALRAIRRLRPRRLVLAVPVCAPDSAARLREEADELVCLSEPRQLYGVGQWYRDFSQVSDEEVVAALGAAGSAAATGERASKARVLIAGAGIAGIEAALALRDLAGEEVEVEMRDPRREFAFRPFAVGEPYGAARIFRYEMAALAAGCGASFHADGIVAVDPERRVAVTRDGERLRYDYLLLATGVRMLWAVPGAVTFWGVADEGHVGEVVADLRAGRLRNLVFTMPGGQSWALPLYELALLGASELAKAGGARTRLIVVTPEDAPLELIGRRAGEQVARLLDEHGIEVVAGAHPVAFEDGRLRVAPGKGIEADAVISLPRLEGRRVAGVPHDASGFVGVDEQGRVIGIERVLAAGDMTSFPVKQGGIATQQADAAASLIASEAGAEVDPEPFDPVLRGVLWTGREPRYLYGRPTGGHGEASSLSEEPRWPQPEGKVIGRYLTSFLDSLADGHDPAATGFRAAS